MGETILVLGGVRSGKSRLAQRLASEREPVTYLATATVEVDDPEMSARIDRHKADRPSSWVTRDVPRGLAEVLPELTEQDGSVLIDCLTLWVTNLMLGLGGGPDLTDEAILAEVDRASEASAEGKARVIWVSNEVGSGGVPIHPVARRFNDLQGLANQRLAASSRAVHLCVAGLSVRIK